MWISSTRLKLLLWWVRLQTRECLQKPPNERTLDGKGGCVNETKTGNLSSTPEVVMFFNGSSFTFIYSRKFVEKAKQICGRSQFFPECVHEVCGPSLQLLTLSPNTRSTRDVFSRTRQLTGISREQETDFVSVPYGYPSHLKHHIPFTKKTTRHIYAVMR